MILIKVALKHDSRQIQGSDSEYIAIHKEVVLSFPNVHFYIFNTVSAKNTGITINIHLRLFSKQHWG